MTLQRGLSAHPRLYIGSEDIDRLQIVPGEGLVARVNETMRKDANRYARKVEIPYYESGHNSLLIRARVNQMRVVTLLARWLQCGRKRYRSAAMEYLANMGKWEYWSWIALGQGNKRPDAIFDLSYGENSATLAIAWDLLHDSLDAEERKMLLAIARRFAVASFMKNAESSGWFGKPDTNWNTVCAGGAGMLALSMAEELPEADKIISLAEKSFLPYMKHLDASDGAWPEGIGYWNYGMRYAFMYLLSHQRATGRKHPLLHQKSTRKTLRFPLDFSPGGLPCSFGDVNSFQPLPFMLATAQALKDRGVLQRAMSRLEREGCTGHHGSWPNEAEMMFFLPREPIAEKSGKPQAVAQLYKGQDWAVLADRENDPTLAVTIRGGTTDVPHNHLDLMSFHCTMNGEPCLHNIGSGEYLDTTFSSRRFEIFEMGAHSKNTLLINGVGITHPSSVKTRLFKVGKFDAVRLQGAQAMGDTRGSYRAASLCNRLLVRLGDEGVLIVDSIKVPRFARFEARFFTPRQVRLQRSAAILKGEKSNARMTFAASGDALLQQATPALTTPTEPVPTMLRWCSKDLSKGIVFATLLSRGAGKASVNVDMRGGKIAVSAKSGSLDETIHLTQSLLLQK